MKPPPPPSLRYTILCHGGVSEPHFDLLFETAPGSALATWRSPVWPISALTEVVRVADHRSLYLDYEGPLTDGRGWVRQVETGECQVTVATGKVMVKLLPAANNLRFTWVAGSRWRAVAIARR